MQLDTTKAVCLSIALFSWSQLLAKPVIAEPPPTEDFQQLITKGLADYDAHRYVEARASIEKAHARAPSARTLRALGVIDFALDDFNLAKEELEAALLNQNLPLNADQRRDVSELLDWMRANLATVYLNITPRTAEVRVDGKLVSARSVLLSEGSHQLQVSAPGFEPRTETISPTRAQTLPVGITLDARPGEVPTAPVVEQQHPEPSTPAPASSQAAAWAWTAAGAAMLVGGGVLIALSVAVRNTVSDAKDGVMLSEIDGPHGRAPWFMAGSVALGIAGAAALTLGVVQFSSSGAPRDSVAWSMAIGPGALRVRASF